MFFRLLAQKYWGGVPPPSTEKIFMCYSDSLSKSIGGGYPPPAAEKSFYRFQALVRRHGRLRVYRVIDHADSESVVRFSLAHSVFELAPILSYFRGVF